MILPNSSMFCHPSMDVVSDGSVASWSPVSDVQNSPQ
mgnify:CR=1 FL=1